MGESQTTQLSFISQDIPGTGGVIKQRPEDFLVAERPAYEPCGTGEHVYLFVEKRNRATLDVTRRLAKLFHISPRDVGYAGLKDKYAVTQQWFSVLQHDDDLVARAVERMAFTPFRLLWHARHENKLRRGHLTGNRFVIRIRNYEPGAPDRARQTVRTLATRGVPNFVGEQRFGYRQNNHIVGRHLLLGRWQEMLDELLGHPRDFESEDARIARACYDSGDYTQTLELWPRQLRHDRQALDALRQGKAAREAVASIAFQQREFLISAMQSHIFNQVLDQRIRSGRFDRLVPGDLAWKHENRSLFRVDESTAEMENASGGRMESLAVSPSGPLWGGQMYRPAGRVLAEEQAALHAFGLSEADLVSPELCKAEGSRRPMCIPLIDPEVSEGRDEAGPFIRVGFELTRGAFATIVLREIMKTGDLPEESGD